MSPKLALQDAHQALLEALTEEAEMLARNEVIPAAKREHIRASVVRLAKLFGTTERFSQLIGKGRRTVSRWQEENAKHSPKLAEVRTWLPILEEAIEDSADSRPTDMIQPPTDELAGVFTARSIQERLRNANSAWAFKSRARFHAADDHDSMELMIELLQKEKFTFNCVWIDPEDKQLKDSSNFSEARPLKVAQDSFDKLYRYIEASQEVANLNSKLRGFPLSSTEAARWGLANAPASMLVLTYGQEHSRRYLTDVDVFYEMTLATYNRLQPDRLKSIERSYWLQILPSLGASYMAEVWSNFSGMKNQYTPPLSR